MCGTWLKCAGIKSACPIFTASRYFSSHKRGQNPEVLLHAWCEMHWLIGVDKMIYLQCLEALLYSTSSSITTCGATVACPNTSFSPSLISSTASHRLKVFGFLLIFIGVLKVKYKHKILKICHIFKSS